MNKIERNNLIIEAKRQSEALKRISRWRAMAVLMSAIGIVFTWMGFGRGLISVPFCVIGILMILTGTVLAVIFNLGIKNGRTNVEKILDAVERGK